MAAGANKPGAKRTVERRRLSLPGYEHAEAVSNLFTDSAYIDIRNVGASLSSLNCLTWAASSTGIWSKHQLQKAPRNHAVRQFFWHNNRLRNKSRASLGRCRLLFRDTAWFPRFLRKRVPARAPMMSPTLGRQLPPSHRSGTFFVCRNPVNGNLKLSANKVCVYCARVNSLELSVLWLRHVADLIGAGNRPARSWRSSRDGGALCHPSRWTSKIAPSTFLGCS